MGWTTYFKSVQYNVLEFYAPWYGLFAYNSWAASTLLGYPKSEINKNWRQKIRFNSIWGHSFCCRSSFTMVIIELVAMFHLHWLFEKTCRYVFLTTIISYLVDSMIHEFYCRHYNGSCFMSNGVIPSINTLRPREIDRHLADDIFNCIFVNENIYISIKISLKFVPKGPINN